ncbi:MAG: RnfH family protein [Pseudomonadota bacterium]
MDQLAERQITVEVIYATAAKQERVIRNVSPDATAREVVLASGLDQHFEQLDLSCVALGIWGEVISCDHRLNDGDRIELYRRLENDPREARMRLAREGKTMGAAIAD